MYRRVLLVIAFEADAGPAIGTIRRVAPHAQRLDVTVVMPQQRFASPGDEAPADPNHPVQVALDRLYASVADAAARVVLQLLPELDLDALVAQAGDSASELLVIGPLPGGDLALALQLRERRSMAVLWASGAQQPADVGRPLVDLLCVALGARANAAIAAFLRDHSTPAQRATVLLPTGAEPSDAAAAAEIAGVRAEVDFVAPRGQTRMQWLHGRMHERPPDLLVHAQLPLAVAAARWPVPRLLLPPSLPLAASVLERDIDVPDLLDDGAPLRLRVDYAAGFGRRDPVADQEIALVAGGRVVARVRTRAGEARLPDDCRGAAYGVFRTEGRDATRPLAAVETSFVVLRAATRPLLLFDAELETAALSTLGALVRRGAPAAPELLAVRLRATRSCRAIRERLAAAGLAQRVADARLVLDEGGALDVSEALDAVRLARVGARLRAAGFPVAAIVHRATLAPEVRGFRSVHVDALESLAHVRWEPAPLAMLPASLDERLERTTGASRIAGNRVEVELDNARARDWLLQAIEASQRRVHVQVYMVADDDIGARIEDALARAAARGVTVRVLVDSLHAWHGSLGTRNPMLERLASHRGIELLAAGPIEHVPSLLELKQRDHRKLVVADNRIALLGGRNFSHEYYTGFDEVSLTRDSPWREVPWLDAGARVQGPAVATLERAFRDAWIDAGGSSFAVDECAVAGNVTVRTVIHHGLRDAATLEAYLALIETAKSHVVVVNGFPLILEIQHALLRALRRGVRVCILCGNLTPRHGDRAFTGPWSSARTAATALVHSRVDALVGAGAEGYEFCVAQQPHWEPGLGAVRTHVHAKLMSVDASVCAVGSANMDITGGYWESEGLLVIEDRAIAATVEASIDELIATSVRIDRDDPQWRQDARAREWMRYWPGVLSI